jgi:hypothetical protein
MGVLDLAQRSSLHVQGSGTFPWGSGPTVDILEYIVFPGHVATLESSTRWGRMLFTTASSCCSKGYPCFRIPRMAPRPTLGEDASLHVGPKLAPYVSMA